MKFRSFLRAVMALALTAASAIASAQVSFTGTYRGGSTSTCGVTYSIIGKEPIGAGRYPLFIYTSGTGEPYTSAWAMSAIDEAVSRGYVAASVQYDNATFGTCSTISTRARCIFNSANSNSAVNRLCARSKVDCSRGIVTGGLSQGSIISVLSGNYNSGVRASFGQGTGTTYTVAYNLATCMTAGRYTQSPDRVRIINGEGDMFVGGTEAIARASAERVTGLSCLGRQSCFRSNGSGWYIVKHYEVLDLFADHCFMGYGGTAAVQCAGILASDANYVYGNNQWGVKASINFLKGFTD
jgi:hypothetical protein